MVRSPARITGHLSYQDSICPVKQPETAAELDQAVKLFKMCSGGFGEGCGENSGQTVSPYGRFGVYRFRGPIMNSVKHILNNTIAPHGMKIERFLLFYPSAGVKTLA
jgi:hypothetical protein